MWRSTTFRAFARWGLCQRHRPRAQPPAQDLDHADRLIAPLTTFGTKDHKRSSSEKETFNKGRFFADKPEISLLETVGWVGTILTVGLNFRLHSKRDGQANGNEARQLPGHVCTSSPFSICSLVHKFLLQFALTSPLFGQSSASKSVLPRESTSDHGVPAGLAADPAATSAAKSLPLASSDRLEEIARECIGQVENFKGAQLFSSNARKAVKHFERAQTLGTSSAHYNLGVCHENGTGTAKDLEKAAYHYEQAALGGHAMATYNLGVFYLEGLGGLNPDPDKGLSLIKKASSLGVPQAKTYIGQQYLHQCLWEEAVSLFRDAAEENDSDASYYLGICYANGLGVGPDLETAAHYYGRAASAGDEDAAAALRDLHLKPRKETEGAPRVVPEIMISDDSECRSVAEADSVRSQEGSRLHHSSSSPELSQRGAPQNATKRGVNITQYLDLVLPDIFLRQKPTFGFSDDEDFVSIPDGVSRVACHEACVAV